MRTISLSMILALFVTAWIPLALPALAEEPKKEDPKKTEEPKLVKAGTLTVTQFEAGIGIGDVVWGHGVVKALGTTRKFKTNGMGVGTAGGAKIAATGTVYNLKEIGQFPGVYSQGGIGAVAGKEGKSTATWMRNTNGVILELKGTSSGFAITGGADGVVIQFED